jgi:nucleotidyltransferase substrate binding protein (TIGR01987 family)
MDDARWMQRFSNYRKAVANLEAALCQESYNDLELQGFIKGFELCHELAWKTLQDLLHERGYADVAGPKPVIRQAFKDGLLSDGNVWRAIQ